MSYSLKSLKGYVEDYIGEYEGEFIRGISVEEKEHDIR